MHLLKRVAQTLLPFPSQQPTFAPANPNVPSQTTSWSGPSAAPTFAPPVGSGAPSFSNPGGPPPSSVNPPGVSTSPTFVQIAPSIQTTFSQTTSAATFTRPGSPSSSSSSSSSQQQAGTPPSRPTQLAPPSGPGGSVVTPPRPEDQDHITIESVSTSGNGCPSGTVSVSISLDRTLVTLGFDDFHVGSGVSFTPLDASKNCDIVLTLRYPAGYTYSVLETTYHGFARLDDGARGSIEASYGFADDAGRAIDIGPVAGENPDFTPVNGGGSGNGFSVTSQAVLTGGGAFSTGDTFTLSELVPLDQRVPSPCEGENVNLHIKTRVSMTGNGMITDEDATFALTQQVHLGWEKCN